MEKETKKKVFKGSVVASPMQKTAIVAVTRYVRHPQYGKYRQVTKRYKVHDPDGIANPGDVVSFEACRPISKEKRFRLLPKDV
ncbi:MAG: 30S ribosomal protein S17 [Candidatus Kaiserbacteria bacterium]|nr:30S ribosomal protein S17 [Candidatus Kaiserbacteria bacterium]